MAIEQKILMKKLEVNSPTIKFKLRPRLNATLIYIGQIVVGRKKSHKNEDEKEFVVGRKKSHQHKYINKNREKERKKGIKFSLAFLIIRVKKNSKKKTAINKKKVFIFECNQKKIMRITFYNDATVRILKIDTISLSRVTILDLRVDNAFVYCFE